MVDHWVDDVRRRLEEDLQALSEHARADISRLCEIVEDSPDYRYRNESFLDFEAALARVEGFDDLSGIMLAVAKSTGFDHGTLVLLKSGAAIEFTKRVCTSFPEAWLRRYGEKGYQYVDPVVMRALSSQEPFLFSDLPPLPPFSRGFWDDAVAHGIGREGCCFSYKLEADLMFAVSFTSMDEAGAVSERFLRSRSDLGHFGALACETFLELAGSFRPGASRLRLDELLFLKRLLSSPSTVDAIELLEGDRSSAQAAEICRRMGVSNIFQALVLVDREPWVDELPYEESEVSLPSSGSRDPSGARVLTFDLSPVSRADVARQPETLELAERPSGSSPSPRSEAD